MKDLHENQWWHFLKPTRISNSKQYIPPESHVMKITSQIQDHLPAELCHAFEGMDFPTVFHCYSALQSTIVSV